MARGRASKATKKFESKHLTHTLEARKIQKRNKDKYNKNKGRNDVRKVATVQAEMAPKKPIESGKGTLFDGMTMDEFLETGGEKGDVEMKEVEEMERAYKSGLDGLQEKDPSFYEFLKQNDRALLEFDPDELVEGDEDEDEEEVGDTEGGLTVEILGRWEQLLIEQKSLGTLKKVLIAVRNAAANVTGEESQGNAKYILTDPQGDRNPKSILMFSIRSITISGISTNSRSSPTPRPSNRKKWKIYRSLPK